MPRFCILHSSLYPNRHCRSPKVTPFLRRRYRPRPPRSRQFNPLPSQAQTSRMNRTSAAGGSTESPPAFDRTGLVVIQTKLHGPCQAPEIQWQETSGRLAQWACSARDGAPTIGTKMLLAQPTGPCQTSSWMSHQPDNISAGTRVVALVVIHRPNKSLVHPRGAVGVVTRTQAGDDPKATGEMNSVPQLSTTNHQFAQRQHPDHGLPGRRERRTASSSKCASYQHGKAQARSVYEAFENILR
jgi:hypothetical protein